MTFLFDGGAFPWGEIRDSTSGLIYCYCNKRSNDFKTMVLFYLLARFNRVDRWKIDSSHFSHQTII
jgi:hypothetical protein